MKNRTSKDSGPLGTASLNHLFKEILEGWWASCLKTYEQQGFQEEFLLKIDSRDQLLVLLAHLALLAVGFKAKEKENQGDYVRLPNNWNSNEPYEFEYTHSQSQLHFQLKAIKMGTRTIIHATALETNDTHSLEVLAEDYIPDQVTFPLKLTSAAQISELDLSKLFSTPSRFAKYMDTFRTQILQKLIPGLQKEGYQEIATESTTSLTGSSQPRNPQRLQEPLGSSQFYPAPLNFPGGRNPLAYGGRDLNPLGGVGPGLPRFGGGGSALDPFGMFGDDQGGMILGPRHPMFAPNPNAPPFPGRGPYLPPGAAPPGARFDPISPFDPSVRDPRSQMRGQPPRPPFSGEPDNDEAPPPVSFLILHS
ncbi:hypothetical protein DSO57_1022086 [Entomophthora muscae]|uniref:Uncharacterized protein n=1 Tax=Entomophthora muscae TaxID=34485 RepID=A0ACC2SG02_9FUNG|nr:hypothetical protein DSO57_1022086 [Entomophthora muscae]